MQPTQSNFYPYYPTNEWLEIFQRNATKTLHVGAERRQLTVEEFHRVARSLPDFQLGESAEGRTLRRLARQFSDRYGLPSYAETVDLFIREENRHASYLLQFMRQHGIPRAKQTVNDSAFRFIRKLLGIETIIRTLVTGEIVALSYYTCLSEATDSSVLTKVCERILREEDVHVSFQMQHIEFLNLQKTGPFAFISDLLHCGLLNAALMAVWLRHHRVLGTRHSLFSFVAQANWDFAEAVRHGRVAAREMLTEWRLRKASCPSIHEGRHQSLNRPDTER